MYAITLHMMLQAYTIQVWGCTVDVHTHALNCRQTLPHLFEGLQTVSLHQYAPHYVSNVHGKFQSCAAGVQATTMIYNNPNADLGVCVHTQCMPLRSI